MRGTSPDELAAFTLAVLDEDVAAGILHAAILKLAVHEDTVIQNDVLTLEGLVFIPIHKFARKVSPRASCERASCPRRCLGLQVRIEATIHVAGMQAALFCGIGAFCRKSGNPFDRSGRFSLSVCGFQDYTAPPLADFWSCAVRGPAIAGRRSDSTPDCSRTRAAE